MYNYIHSNELDSLSVLLERNVRNKLLDEAIRKAGNQKELGNILNIGQWTVSRWKTGRFLIPLSIISKLKDYTGLKIKEESILKVGSSQGSLPISMKFPFKLDEDLAYLIGLIITDGHLNKNLSWVQFVNKEKELRDLFIEKIRNVFNHNRFYFDPKNFMCIYVKNKTIATIFWKLGIPKGKKYDSVSVPKPIFSSSQKVISAFLRGCFDGDGSVAYTKHEGLRIINFASSSKQMIRDINKILLKFQIQNSIVFNKRGMGYINITSRNNLEKYSKYINFNHPKRSENLSHILKTYCS